VSDAERAPTKEERSTDGHGAGPAEVVILSGEPAALFDRYYDMVLTYATRRLLNMSDAEDVTAETFTRALAALPSMSTSEPARRAWLYRTATNLIHDLRRRRGRREETSLEDITDLARWVADPDPDPEALTGRLEELAALERALRALGDRYESVLALRFFEGLTTREIAKVLGIRPGTVKWRAHVALRRLGAILASEPAFQDRQQPKGERS